MKQAKTAAIFLFLFIVCGGILEQIYVKKTFDLLLIYHNQIKSKIESFEFKQTQDDISKLEVWWNKQVVILESLSNNRDLRNISTDISRLHCYIKSENLNDATACLESIESSAIFVKTLLSFKFMHII